MPWKTCFHGVEVFPKLASMAWKNGENGFHGVELFAAQERTTTLFAGGARGWREGTKLRKSQD
jgi:hypothetical protein